MQLRAHYDKLVQPGWLAAQQGNLPDLLLVEVGDGAEAAYRQGHLQGAIYLDTNRIERPPTWNVIPDRELEAALCAHGITCNRQVILYGDDPIAVARIVLVLMYAGVNDVRWLAGGKAAWQAAGYALETGDRSPGPCPAFGLEVPAQPQNIAGLAQVRAALQDPGAVLVCVRSWEEYTGQVSGYDYIQARGRIPGSVWAGYPWPGIRLVQHAGAPQETEHLCRALASAWKEKGLTPDKKIIFYCGTGWRASEAFFYAYLMGWQEISVYDGGWLEWSGDRGNPIQAGEP